MFALGACGSSPEARADTSRSDSTRCEYVSADSAAQPRETPTAHSGPADSAGMRLAGAADSAASVSITPDSAAAAKDSTLVAVEPRIEVRVAPGRSKKDSLSLVSEIRNASKFPGWPVKGPAQSPCAILPRKRIVAFYGNTLTPKMGILGSLPTERMLARLDSVAALWHAADPETPVQPALHYIAVVASGDSGRDGKWRTRMDSAKIEEVYGWAQKRNAILFLDIQAGQSTIQAELPRLMKFLARPDVHLGIDPEFYMHYKQEGIAPGQRVGTLSAKEVNWTIAQLGALVAEKKLPPKVLVLHRFTRPMLRDPKQIKLDPRVQVVIHMDGWGAPWLKFDSYKEYVAREPVQYAGFKLFLRNDTKKGDKLLTPMEVLQLKPAPIYIQYQ